MTNPSTLIFLGLAVVWAIVLLPEGIKRFSRMRRSDSIRSFNHQLLALDRRGSRSGPNNVIELRRGVGGISGPRSVGRPSMLDRADDRSVSVDGTRTQARQISPEVRRRRQEVIATLSAAVVLTLLCLLAFGSAFLVPQLVADALLATYLYMVVQANRASVMTGLSPLARTMNDSVGQSQHRSAGVRVVSVRTDDRPVAAVR